MTIASQTSRIAYTGDGSTTAFAVPFFFAAHSDLVVIQQDLNGNQTTLVLGTNYNLSGATVSTGGTCTFVSAPTTGYLISIYRDPPVTQTTSYNNNDPFPAKSHENALDKLTTLIQRIKDQVSRALHFADGEASISSLLASVATRKNKLLGFDGNGALIYAVGPTFVGSTATGVATVDSRGTASVTAFAVSINVIVTEGLSSPGDGGGGTYVRGTISSPGAFLDGGGVQYWGLVNANTSAVATFDTRTAAVATRFGANIDVINTTNYSTVGDNGGAKYIRTGATTPGGFQSADGQWWKLSNGNVFTATSFGVKADGSTDDTAAIQAAINACLAQNNARLILPIGLIKLTSTITISTASVNFSMVGQGRFATCFMQATDYGDVFSLFSTPTALFAEFGINSLALRTNGAYFKLDSCYEATFRNLWLSEPFVGIKCINCAGCLFTDINIIGAQYFASPYQSGSRHIWLALGGAGNTALRFNDVSCNGSAAPATFSRFEYAFLVDTVDGLWMNNVSMAAANQAMFAITKGSGIKCSNCWTDFYANNGLLLNGASTITDVSFASCTFEGSVGYGVNVNSSGLNGLMFSACSISFNTLNGMLVQLGSKILLNGCFFWANSGTPLAAVGGNNIAIHGCAMNTATANNITIGAAVSRGTIIGNMFTNATVGFDIVSTGALIVTANNSPS